MTSAATPWDVLNQAHQALRGAVQGVADDDWQRPTPCDQWTVTQVLQHAAGDQLAYAAAITGEPGPTFNPFAPSGTIDEAPLAMLEPFLNASARAWASVGADDLDVPTPLPQGRLPATVGVGACALDAAIHAWDIAVATGQPSPLDADLARVRHARRHPPGRAAARLRRLRRRARSRSRRRSRRGAPPLSRPPPGLGRGRRRSQRRSKPLIRSRR